MPSSGQVLGVAAFGAFLAFLDSTIVNVAFPSIQASFPHSPLSSLSWVLNAYNIVFAGFLVVFGRLADLLGRRRMFIGGTILFTLSSVACGLSTSVGMLISFRVIQGVGAAILVPASLALVTEAFSAERLTHGVSLWGATAALAAGLGPPIGGALVSGSSWRLAFFVNVPFGIVAVFVARRTLVESRAPGRRRMPDLRGALLLALGIGALTLGIVKGGDWGWGSPRVIASFVIGLLLLTGFGVSNSSHPAPVLDPSLLRRRRFLVANIATLFAAAGFYAYTLNHILWLHYVWGYSLFRAGLAVAPGALVAAVTAAVVGQFADRNGHRRYVVAGAVVWAFALGYLYAHRVGVHPDFVGQWLPAQLISGVGVGSTLPILGSSSLVGIPGGRYATASAANSSVRQVGAVLGIAILVAIVGTSTTGFAALHALRHGWVFSSGCFVVAALIGAFLPSSSAEQAEKTDDLSDHSERVVDLRSSTHIAEPDQLPRTSLLEQLPPTVRAEVRQAMKSVELRGGQYLFHRGDPCDGLYLLTSGQLEVIVDDQVVSRLGRGAVVGELAVLTGEPRSASIRAARDSTLAHLSIRQFKSLAKTQPALPLALASLMAKRLQAVSSPPISRGHARVIAVVGMTPDLPVEAVSALLHHLLKQRLDVSVVDHVSAAGLERAESQHDRVLLTADADDEDWREFCLRVADRVVVVTDGSTVGASSLRDGPDYDIVVTGRSFDRAERLAWHEAVNVLSINSFGDSGPIDGLTRLADRLSGRAVGLVLAGGGARAFAHLGVLAELEAAGIRIDRVAGTSNGAAIGAMVAMGASAESVDATCHEEFVRHQPVGDYVIPRHSIIAGNRVFAAIKRRVGDTYIEELPLEFHAVSVDLLNRTTVTHSRGPVIDAVMASLRLPGLFPPYRIGDSLHVDGGVMDNVPVDALADRREGPIIAVNIGMGSGKSRREGPPRMPSLTDTMMRTMLLSSGARTAESLARADLVITPSAAGVGLLEWHQIDVAREAGREATVQAMPILKELTALPGRTPTKQPRARVTAGAR